MALEVNNVQHTCKKCGKDFLAPRVPIYDEDYHVSWCGKCRRKYRKEYSELM